jgi:hypothetical protein
MHNIVAQTSVPAHGFCTTWPVTGLTSRNPSVSQALLLLLSLPTTTSARSIIFLKFCFICSSRLWRLRGNYWCFAGKTASNFMAGNCERATILYDASGPDLGGGGLTNIHYSYFLGHVVAWMVGAIRYKLEGRGFESRWGNWNYLIYPIFSIQRYQNKVLRCLVNAPWYARNSDIHRELGVETIASMKNGVLWDVTACGSCKNRRFGGT